MVLKRVRRGLGRLRRLPARWAVPLVTLAVTGLAVASVYGYRTYNFVQHDNDFCLSCHLMQDPYERFARSDHRGLGCKACHQPTPVVRAQMGLTQILEQPESLTVHAAVPNQRCIDCHVDGDPEDWLLISSSAGHRIHLESRDPELRDLECVQCHSTSVHEFAATSRTCAQSACHETTEITLGKMGDLTMHCIACHDFSKPVAASLPPDSLRLALQPQRDQCLSCHQMRILISDLPDDEPHNGECGLCHDPHKQTRPAEAVQSCASSGCHERMDTVSPMHRGLAADVLAACTRCHRAHRFRLDQPRCIDCHQDILTRPSPRRWSAAGTTNVTPTETMAMKAAFTHETAPVRTPLTSAFTHEPAPVQTVVRVALQQRPQTRPAGSGVPFEHVRHQTLDCSACHAATGDHGALKITTFRDCQSCHHAGSTQAACTRCHAETEFRSQAYPQPITLRISAGNARRARSITFRHTEHPAIECAQCHTDPVSRTATGMNCQSCHTQHHDPVRECRACHTPAPARAHDLKVHTGCAGSGCHSQLPVAGVPRTREFCLVCHQDLVQHRPGGNCAQCHVLPPARSQPADTEAQ